MKFNKIIELAEKENLKLRKKYLKTRNKKKVVIAYWDYAVFSNELVGFKELIKEKN